MAGLLEQQNQQRQQQPTPEGRGGTQGQGAGVPQEGSTAENSPVFQAAIKWLNKALYDKGAADGIHTQIVEADDPVNAITFVAYELTGIGFEKTGGRMPAKLLAPFGMTVLNEVVEIAIASGVKLRPRDVAAALKNMVLQFVEDAGMDTTELEQAMESMDPSEFDNVAGSLNNPASAKSAPAGGAPANPSERGVR